MKKPSRPTAHASLHLSRETIRSLRSTDLDRVAAGLAGSKSTGVIGVQCPKSGTSDQPGCGGDPYQQ